MKPAVALLLTGCGALGTSPAPADVGAPVRPLDAGVAAPAVVDPAAASAGYEVAPPAPSGTVLGLVTLARLPPAAAVAPVLGPPGCPGSQAVAALTVAPNGGVVGALVWLDVARGKPPVDAPAELAFTACALAPRAVLVPGGQLAVRNDDGVRHEVTVTQAGRELARWPLPLEGSRYTLTLGEPGVYSVDGDATPAAHAIAVVPAHPYYAITDGDGRYRLDGVPPGSYRLQAWHPGLLGQPPLAVSAKVEARADLAVEVPLALAAP